jgi:hypothetical protein
MDVNRNPSLELTVQVLQVADTPLLCGREAFRLVASAVALMSISIIDLGVDVEGSMYIH